MKRLLYIPAALLCLFHATSCIEDDLDPCPAEGGGVTVTLRVEKFRTRPPYAPSDLEEDFTRRIHSLDYLLYADGRLIERGTLPVASAEGGSCVFRHDTLPFGAYRLAFKANTDEEMMTGRPDAPELYYIAYQGENGDDHFTADLPFDVACPYRNEFETVLRRVHGVTRFRFENIPQEVESIEVSLDDVGARMPLSGEPDQPFEAARRVRVSELENGAFLLGTFPTLPGSRTAWRMRLYGADAQTPLLERLVTDTLRIVRNQLIELTTRFPDDVLQDEIDFTVDVDPAWDGSNEGGAEIM